MAMLAGLLILNEAAVIELPASVNKAVAAEVMLNETSLSGREKIGVGMLRMT